MSATWLSVLARTEYFSIGFPLPDGQVAGEMLGLPLCFEAGLVASFPSTSIQAQSPIAKTSLWPADSGLPESSRSSWADQGPV